jgi:amino acid permease
MNTGNIFLPFGVILFALMSFHSIPELQIVLHKNERLMKKVLISGTLISIVFYALFAFIVVGIKGFDTPEIATLALGSTFVLLGIFTMFTSYLSLGNALQENLMYDERFRKKEAWFFTSIIPILIFLFIKSFSFFSFISILSIGGIVSGGLIALLILLMVKKAKEKGNRKPEYSIPANWFILGILSLIFIFGIFAEIF